MLDIVAKERLIHNFENNLPVLRAKLGMSQAELAERTGISRQTILNIENKRTKMTWHVFLVLVLVFSYPDATRELLKIFDIYTNELDCYLHMEQSKERLTNES